MEELAELPVHRLRRRPTQVSVLPLLPSRAAADALAVVFVSPSCRPSRVEWARRLLPCFLLIGSRIENDKTSFDSFVLETPSSASPLRSLPFDHHHRRTPYRLSALPSGCESIPAGHD
uniref:Uncharacterized protein n=1 Tax=Oryza meridionalis TaxID=40149 RepID=A0A0E0E286_9ORYZ